MDVKWLAFPLHPETPDEGVSLQELFKGRNLDVDKMLQHLKAVAESLGLPFGDRKMTYNSRLAQELGKWAEAQGRGDAFHLAAFKAYFAEGRNLADIGQLAGMAAAIDLDEAAALEVLRERTYRSAVDRDWREAHARGITAVPTFLANGRRLVGAQPYEALEGLITGDIL